MAQIERKNVSEVKHYISIKPSFQQIHFTRRRNHEIWTSPGQEHWDFCKVVWSSRNHSLEQLNRIILIPFIPLSIQNSRAYVIQLPLRWAKSTFQTGIVRGVCVPSRGFIFRWTAKFETTSGITFFPREKHLNHWAEFLDRPIWPCWYHTPNPRSWSQGFKTIAEDNANGSSSDDIAHPWNSRKMPSTWQQWSFSRNRWSLSWSLRNSCWNGEFWVRDTEFSHEITEWVSRWFLDGFASNVPGVGLGRIMK
jgi:hypothetical protein